MAEDSADNADLLDLWGISDSSSTNVSTISDNVTHEAPPKADVIPTEERIERLRSRIALVRRFTASTELQCEELQTRIREKQNSVLNTSQRQSRGEISGEQISLQLSGGARGQPQADSASSTSSMGECATIELRSEVDFQEFKIVVTRLGTNGRDRVTLILPSDCALSSSEPVKSLATELRSLVFDYNKTPTATIPELLHHCRTHLQVNFRP